jgi:hypothetical protein
VNHIFYVCIANLRFQASSVVVHGEVDNSVEEVEKHMMVKFSVLELHLRTKGHVFGAFVFHLLGMNPSFSGMQRLKVVIQRSLVIICSLL